MVKPLLTMAVQHKYRFVNRPTLAVSLFLSRSPIEKNYIRKKGLCLLMHVIAVFQSLDNDLGSDKSR